MSLLVVIVEEGQALVRFLVGAWQLDEEDVPVGLVEDSTDVHDDIVPLTLLEEHCSNHQQILRAHLPHLIMYYFKLAMCLFQQRIQLLLDSLKMVGG